MRKLSLKVTISASLLAGMLAAPINSIAQEASPEALALLGSPANVEQSALFAATRTTYKQFCGGLPTEEVRANGINRLNYASLDDAGKLQFKELMQRQQISNYTLMQGMDLKHTQSFCEGLDRTVSRMVAQFIVLHPELFENVPPSDEESNNPLPLKERDAGNPALRSEILRPGVQQERLRQSKIDREARGGGFANTPLAGPAGWLGTIRDQFWHGGNITVSFGKEIYRKLNNGPTDPEWRGERIRAWLDNQTDMRPEQEQRYFGTINQNEAEALFDDAMKRAHTIEVQKARYGWSATAQ